MAMGQLYEQMPHCTQRAGSGTTWPDESAVRRVESDLKILMNDKIILFSVSRPDQGKVAGANGSIIGCMQKIQK